ncbi:MAG TPA: hypothetical protein VMA75_04645 [Candidatus Paceibacterota bacterium]|nr:hypothetical protein [Candidatus Paceibacterota bacterium]
MKLSDILKQFKNIEPDPRFTERSKREILLSPQPERRTMRGIMIFLHTLETGVAVALAGFFILILTNSFSPTSSLAPIQYSVIDPQGLHAEAQAIDMQIQLANVAYSQVTSTAVTGSTATGTAPTALAKAFGKAAAGTATSTGSAVTTGESTSTASTTALSVDQALQQLSH